VTGSAAPAVLPAVGWRFPTAIESRLRNGIRVLAYHCPGQYVVNASLLFDLPLSAEPRRTEGVAGLVARCLSRGAGGLSADDFSDALAAAGAEMDATAASDGFTVRLSVPESHLARGLDLMAMAVTRPTYAEREFEQEKRLRLQEIEQAKAYPSAVTVERLNAALFGDSRAARPVGGATATVDAVTRDDVMAYASAHLRPDHAVLILAGDFEAADPHAFAERAFSAWQSGGGDVVVPQASPVSTNPRLLLVDWPDTPQATLRLAAEGITRGDPKWPALFVANYAVGGNFGSRLNTVLREEKGFTYGVSSTLDSDRQIGLLGVAANVRSDATAEAVGDILSILRDARGTLGEEETATGIRAVTDSAALSYERAETIVARVEMLVSQGLPLDHVDTNLRRIRDVTAADANAAYQSVVRPETFTIVVAGAASMLREPLESLGHAPVEVLPRP
jgi:zinc protease